MEKLFIVSYTVNKRDHYEMVVESDSINKAKVVAINYLNSLYNLSEKKTLVITHVEETKEKKKNHKSFYSAMEKQAKSERNK